MGGSQGGVGLGKRPVPLDSRKLWRFGNFFLWLMLGAEEMRDEKNDP